MSGHRAKQVCRIALLCAEQNKDKKPSHISAGRWINHIMALTKSIYKGLPKPQRAKWISQFPYGAVNIHLRNKATFAKAQS